jgi:NAD(P)-dependent dehydrogenase (short-subunit alcohol dehydrogenase family)
MRLRDKTAIITGGGIGMGRASVLRFLEEGAKVVVADINEENMAETVRLGKQISDNVIGIKVDLTKEQDVKHLVEKTVEAFGTVDILFNNAGMNHAALLHETTLEDWEMVFNVNIKSMFLTCKYVLPIMMEHKKGSIINTASPGALVGLRGISAYCASKGAVPSLTRSIAVDYAPYNIRANFLCPGVILTEMTEKIIQTKPNPDEYREWYRKARPLGRFGEPVEIANAAVYLASDETAFMTGASIVADGGFTSQ